VNESNVEGLGRRAVLRAMLVTAVVAVGWSTAEAQAKAPQKVVQYQQTPKGDQTCDKCLHWVAPDGCKLVEGKINPKGWCVLYVVKPK